MRNTVKLFVIFAALLTALTACSFKEANPYDNQQTIVNTVNNATYEALTQDIDEGQALLGFDQLSGVETLFVFQGSQEVTITVYEKLESGKAKIVLVDPYDRVIEVYETTTFHTAGGRYELKVVGDEACGRISVSVSAQDSISFLPLSK
jgi:hypothetical protein